MLILKKLPLFIRIWIIFFFVSIVLVGLIYLAVQQNFRQGANDPQIQIVQDTISALEKGQSPQTLVGTTYIDLSKSLSPFLIIFDEQGKAISSQTTLNNQIPTPPSGVFDFARIHGEDRFTWQPQDGIREAAIVKHYQNGFVLVGRSLIEVEKRVEKLLFEVATVWVISMLGSLSLSFILL